ncbi:MAG: hypothetical protein CFH34_00167 [Alphaproteobacteria bacterium MarineAlpha9_Bin4]|nr:MAG: hypothetical protein CFH34_00167 [Alphaproteobacteria bacterium MarineAlpha9_Bin4]
MYLVLMIVKSKYTYKSINLFFFNIISSVILFLVYFFTIVSTGLIMKILKRDPMKRKFDKDSKSYWIKINNNTKKFNLRDQY